VVLAEGDYCFVSKVPGEEEKQIMIRDDYGKLFFNILDYTGSATFGNLPMPMLP
jgi:hypothetical protein